MNSGSVAGETRNWRTLQSVLARLVPELANDNRFPGRPPSLSPKVIAELLAENAALAPEHFEYAKSTSTGAAVLEDLNLTGDINANSRVLTEAAEKMTAAAREINSAITLIDQFIAIYQPEYPQLRKPGREAHEERTTDLGKLIAKFEARQEEFGEFKDRHYDAPPVGRWWQRGRKAVVRGFKKYIDDLKTTRVKTYFENTPIPERGRLKPPRKALIDHMRGIHDGWSGSISITSEPLSWKYFGNNWHIQTLAGRALKVAHREKRVWERLAADARVGQSHTAYAQHLDGLNGNLHDMRNALLRTLRTLRFAPETIAPADDADIPRSEFDELVDAFSEVADITDEGLFGLVDRIHTNTFGTPTTARDREMPREGLERPSPTDRPAP